MGLLVACKNHEDRIKSGGDRVVTTLFNVFFKCSRAVNSEVSDGILPKFKLIQAFMVVLVICKNKEIHPKIKALEWSHYIYQL